MNGVDRSGAAVSVNSGRTSATATSSGGAAGSSTISEGSGSSKREWRFFVNPATEVGNYMNIEVKDQLGWTTVAKVNAKSET